MQHRLNDIVLEMVSLLLLETGASPKVSMVQNGTLMYPVEIWIFIKSSMNKSLCCRCEFGLILTSVNGMQWEEQVVGNNTISHMSMPMIFFVVEWNEDLSFVGHLVLGRSQRKRYQVTRKNWHINLWFQRSGYLQVHR